MKILCVLLAIVAGPLAACSQRRDGATSVATTTSGSLMGNASLKNGRLIFLTGRDNDGRKIVAAAPPLRPSCAACHGANGAGGQKFPDGAVSADLRHSSLVGKQKPPYTMASIERAISQGMDNQGKPLDKVMPRWRLSPGNLHDVARYVYNLK